MSEVSSEERFILAIGRIEQALSRIERMPPPEASAVGPSVDSALAGRHDRLRAAMREAIERIDRLLDNSEG